MHFLNIVLVEYKRKLKYKEQDMNAFEIIALIKSFSWIFAVSIGAIFTHIILLPNRCAKIRRARSVGDSAVRVIKMHQASCTRQA